MEEEIKELRKELERVKGELEALILLQRYPYQQPIHVMPCPLPHYPYYPWSGSPPWQITWVGGTSLGTATGVAFIGSTA